MGDQTGIAWTNKTWNPWQGCEKVSPGCVNCYMFRDKRRYGQDPSVVVRSRPATFNAPRRYEPGAMVFTCSWSDWFHHDADAWRDDAWAIIDERRDVIFQILTKRHGRIAGHLPATWGHSWPHVWLGVSVESEAWLRRADTLRGIPAAVRFLSIEPQVGPVRLKGRLDGIHWVIVGGESGADARPFNVAWARSIIRDCRDAGVAVFIKQLGANVRTRNDDHLTEDYDNGSERGGWRLSGVGDVEENLHGFREDYQGAEVRVILRDRAGANLEEWPMDLRVRQFPVTRSLVPEQGQLL